MLSFECTRNVNCLTIFAFHLMGINYTLRQCSSNTETKYMCIILMYVVLYYFSDTPNTEHVIALKFCKDINLVVTSIHTEPDVWRTCTDLQTYSVIIFKRTFEKFRDVKITLTNENHAHPTFNALNIIPKLHSAVIYR